MTPELRSALWEPLTDFTMSFEARMDAIAPIIDTALADARLRGHTEAFEKARVSCARATRLGLAQAARGALLAAADELEALFGDDEPASLHWLRTRANEGLAQ